MRLREKDPVPGIECLGGLGGDLWESWGDLYRNAEGRGWENCAPGGTHILQKAGNTLDHTREAFTELTAPDGSFCPPPFLLQLIQHGNPLSLLRRVMGKCLWSPHSGSLSLILFQPVAWSHLLIFK